MKGLSFPAFHEDEFGVLGVNRLAMHRPFLVPSDIEFSVLPLIYDRNISGLLGLATNT